MAIRAASASLLETFCPLLQRVEHGCGDRQLLIVRIRPAHFIERALRISSQRGELVEICELLRVQLRILFWLRAPHVPGQGFGLVERREVAHEISRDVPKPVHVYEADSELLRVCLSIAAPDPRV